MLFLFWTFLLQSQSPAGLSFSSFRSTVPWTPSCTRSPPASSESRWRFYSAAGRGDTPWRKTAKASPPPRSLWRRHERLTARRQPTSSSCLWLTQTLDTPERAFCKLCHFVNYGSYAFFLVFFYWCIFKLPHDSSTVRQTSTITVLFKSCSGVC